ncbi:MAG: RDD family protein [Chloroflexia bacterium]|nr:RDD family protein [Chloroflexia bacterium]
MEYAGFWNRFVAIVIDSVLLAIVGIITNILFNENAAGFVGFLVGWLYFAGLESSAGQATIGKSAMGLVVTDTNGNRISFLRATGRYFGKILSALILLIGYIMAAFTARKQALHDILASTLVLKR